MAKRELLLIPGLTMVELEVLAVLTIFDQPLLAEVS